MKALKIMLVILGLLLAGYVATSWYLSNNLDRIVKEAIEASGSEQLETTVRLDRATVSLAKTSARLDGLSFANPPGYSSDPIITLGSIELDVRLRSLKDDVLVVEAITILDPQVNFEIDEKGVSNLDVLAERMNRSGVVKGKHANKKKLIIERLDFRGGTIRATAAQRPDDELVFDFPVVFMTDLGRPDGLPPEEIADQVTAVLLERSMDAAQRAGVDQLVDRQKERLQDKAREKLDEKLKDLLNRD